MMPPETTEKLAKLLQLATGRGAYDGERLAACDRLAALLLANDLEWPALLAASGAALTQEQLEKVYAAGYERGLEDAKPKPAEPEREWSIVGGAGGSRPVGKQIDRLRAILTGARDAEEAGLLSDFEQTFVQSIRERVIKYASSTFVSDKQWRILERLEARFRECGFIG
jgi:hypothetical protein